MRAVLMYHSIDRSGSVISVTPEAFADHVGWMAAGTVRVVSLTELLALDDREDAVAITFDDGLETVRTEAAELLAAHGFPATVFVVSRHVGGDNRWNRAGDPGVPVQSVLGWDALGHLQEQHWTIGAHTRHHRRLTECTPSELADELGGAAEDIRAALGERPLAFAYPYGAVNAGVASAAASQFPIACTTMFQPVDTATRPQLVPRLDAWYFKDAAPLERWGTRSWRRSITIRHMLRTVRAALR